MGELNLVSIILKVKHIPAPLALLFPLKARHLTVLQTHCRVIFTYPPIEDTSDLVLAMHLWKQRLPTCLLACALGDAGSTEDLLGSILGLRRDILMLVGARKVLELERIERFAN